MKKVLIAAALAAVWLTACVKDSSPSAIKVETLAQNTWTVDNRAYRANKVDTGNGTMTAADTSVLRLNPIGVSFYFYNNLLPVVSGKYLVVASPATPNEISFIVTTDSASCQSMDNGGVYADVTISATGKMTLKMPPAFAVRAKGAPAVVQANVGQY